MLRTVSPARRRRDRYRRQHEVNRTSSRSTMRQSLMLRTVSPARRRRDRYRRQHEVNRTSSRSRSTGCPGHSAMARLKDKPLAVIGGSMGRYGGVWARSTGCPGHSAMARLKDKPLAVIGGSMGRYGGVFPARDPWRSVRHRCRSPPPSPRPRSRTCGHRPRQVPARDPWRSVRHRCRSPPPSPRPRSRTCGHRPRLQSSVATGPVVEVAGRPPVKPARRDHRES